MANIYISVLNVSKDTLAFGRILWEKYCKNMNLYEARERISNIFGLRHFFNTCSKEKDSQDLWLYDLYHKHSTEHSY